MTAEGQKEEGEAAMELDERQQALLDELMMRYPVLETVQNAITAAYFMLTECFASGGKLLIAGNGGSCADAEHMVGELMKGFLKKRELPEKLQECLRTEDEENGALLAAKLQSGLPAIALNSHPGLSTAFANDVDGDMVYAQQLCGYGMPGDVFLGISTSGNAKNVDYAVTVAKAKSMKVIGLTGATGGKLGQRADVAIRVPERETYKIQELHLPIYHVLCLMLEEYFFTVDNDF
jgi:D-sedoheptulose 7-phosphate isomerase